MNGFRELEEKLTNEGWYVGWGEPCCSSCAWSCLPDEHETGPFKGQEIDLCKVLFNHEQDCENEENVEVYGRDYDLEDEEDEEEYEGPMLTYTPEEQDSSSFCFAGDKQGVKNLKAIIPIITKCGCKINWSGEGTERPTISWELL